MKKLEEILKELKENLPKHKTYWNWYNFCSIVKKENLLSQTDFNILVQHMREFYLK